jgi:hypothetical protein
MSKRNAIVATAVGAAIAAAVGITTGRWGAGAFLGGSAGAATGFLEALRVERARFLRR